MLPSKFAPESASRLAGNPIAGGQETMREYELTVIYDLSVAEAGGQDASVEALTSTVEARGGKILRVDRWGRRRMAYPIHKAIDGDYIVSRIEIDPANVTALEAALRIDERIYRHLVVRADELPAPPPPREPRRQPQEEPAPAAAPAAVAEATPAVPESPATTDAAAEMGEAEASPGPVEGGAEDGTAPASGTNAEAATETEANA